MDLSNYGFIIIAWMWLISVCTLGVPAIGHPTQPNDYRIIGEAESSDEKVPAQPWSSSPPQTNQFDWIRLKSGEWLKGELKVMLKDELEFDSDELHLLNLDWEDVREVRSTRIFTARFEGTITFQGILNVNEEHVILTVDGEQFEFERSQLLSFVQGEPKEINYWSAKVSFGLNLSRGNTEQTQYSITANTKRQTAGSRLIIDFLGNFKETDGVETSDNQRVTASMDVFATRRFFWRPIFGEYYRDPFKNIQYRITLGAGIGYTLMDTSKTDWSIAGGPAYQTTRFDSVETEEGKREETPALVAGTHFDTALTKRIDFNFDYTLQVLNQASGTYTHHALTGSKIQPPMPKA